MKKPARTIINQGLCYTLGHKWEWYNLTRPVTITRNNTTTYAEHGRKCTRCGYDEYGGVQSFINFIEATKERKGDE